jgi:hypothetical protein
MRSTIARRVSGERAWLVPGLRTKQLRLTLLGGAAYSFVVFQLASGLGTPLAIAFAAMATLVFACMLALPSFAGATPAQKIAAIGILLVAFVHPLLTLTLVQYAEVPAAAMFIVAAAAVVRIAVDRETERFMTLQRIDAAKVPDLSWTEDEAEPAKSAPTPGDLLRPVSADVKAQPLWNDIFRASWLLAWRNSAGQVLSARAAFWITAISLVGLMFVRRWGSVDLIIYAVALMNVIAWVPLEHQGVSSLPRELRMRLARDAALIRIWTFTVLAACLMCAVRALVPGLEWTKLEEHVDVITPLTFGVVFAALAPGLQGLRPLLAALLQRLTVIDQPPPIFHTYAAGILLAAVGLALGGDLHQFLKPLPLRQSAGLFLAVCVVSHYAFHLALRVYYARRDLVPSHT